jgi:hypothetical protein
VKAGEDDLGRVSGACVHGGAYALSWLRFPTCSWSLPLSTSRSGRKRAVAGERKLGCADRGRGCGHRSVLGWVSWHSHPRGVGLHAVRRAPLAARGRSICELFHAMARSWGAVGQGRQSSKESWSVRGGFDPPEPSQALKDTRGCSPMTHSSSEILSRM